jgi:hypothetical protein
MTIDNPLILPLILAALFVGIGLCLYVIVRFFRNYGSSKQSAARKEDGKPPSTGRSVSEDPVNRLAQWVGDSDATTEGVGAPVDVPSVTPVPEGDAVEVFRVLRVGSLGELAVEVEGHRYQKITQIRDGTVGRRVLLAIQELDDFVGPHGKKPLPEMHRLPSSPSVPVEQTRPSDPDLSFLGELQGTSAEASSEQKVDLVGYWRKGIGGALRRGPVEQEPAPKSFIDEIEELLQVRLMSRPDLSPRGIHFRSTATGELRIEVDGRLYERMEAIPDAGIVALLKETIRAWDKS